MRNENGRRISSLHSPRQVQEQKLEIEGLQTENISISKPIEDLVMDRMDAYHNPKVELKMQAYGIPSRYAQLFC